MTKGIIFQIKKGAFEDGPGVRTTFFLKGCPLRCRWCINPEGQNPYPELKFIQVKCTGCGKCQHVCPANAIKMDTFINKIKINRSKCNNCFECVKVCPTGALDRYGQYMTIDEVINEIKKDIPFFRNSGGGVTFGGGEPTFQPEFTYELLIRCQAIGVHTALDTCGYTVNRKAEECLEKADLLLYDIKIFDSSKHKEHTGVDNFIILKNFQHLADIGKPVIVRVPIVPEYTNSVDNILSIAKFLSPMKNILRIDLLPYVKYGSVKYEYLNRDYALKEIEQPTSEYMEHLKAFLEKIIPSIKINVGGVA